MYGCEPPPDLNLIAAALGIFVLAVVRQLLASVLWGEEDDDQASS